MAQGPVWVTLTPTQPGMELTVRQVPQISVPYEGAKLPTGFQALIRNLGPIAETFRLTFPTIPGFTLFNSGDTITVPAGDVGETGIYLVPTDQVPPPGTPISITVTAASITPVSPQRSAVLFAAAPNRADSALTATQSLSFPMPEVHGVTLVSTPAAPETTPGMPVTTTINVKAVGNMPETVTLVAACRRGCRRVTWGRSRWLSASRGRSRSR